MSKSEELNDWAFALKCEKAVEGLKKNGFDAVYCKTGEEVFHYIINEAEAANSVGFGGSMSIADLKICDKLRGMGKEILNHGEPGLTPEQRLAITRRQLTCDLFLASSNAVTLSGELVATGIGQPPCFSARRKSSSSLAGTSWWTGLWKMPSAG